MLPAKVFSLVCQIPKKLCGKETCFPYSYQSILKRIYFITHKISLIFTRDELLERQFKTNLNEDEDDEVEEEDIKRFEELRRSKKTKNDPWLFSRRRRRRRRCASPTKKGSFNLKYRVDLDMNTAIRWRLLCI